MNDASITTHFSAKLESGVSCGPGTLISLHTGSDGILSARVADHSDSYWAHGFALVSGSGTKVTGYAQRVRLDRVGVVDNVDYITLNPGSSIYLGEDGKYAASGTQKVGFALSSSIVFVDLDMQLGA